LNFLVQLYIKNVHKHIQTAWYETWER
jgi:hypothetical protein